MAQVTSSSCQPAHVLFINKTVWQARQEAHLGFVFPRPDPITLHIVTYSDVAFASDEEGLLKSGSKFLLADATEKSSNIAFTSRKSKCVVHYFMGVELLAFVDGVDEALFPRHDI